MIKRPLIFSLLLTGAVGGPYVATNPDWMPDARSRLAALTGRPAVSDLDAPGAMPATVRGIPETPPPLEGIQVDDLADVLRMDVRPEWVLRRWSRVTTVLAEPDLMGLRVPVVTGKQLDDLAGSLTYYFDKSHQVQRLTFHGTSGDASRLASLVEQRYALRPEPTLGAGMYVARWNARPTSVLRVSLAPVVRAEAPHTRLQVMLEINRPARYYGLSDEFARLLHSDRDAGRW